MITACKKHIYTSQYVYCGETLYPVSQLDSRSSANIFLPTTTYFALGLEHFERLAQQPRLHAMQIYVIHRKNRLDSCMSCS